MQVGLSELVHPVRSNIAGGNMNFSRNRQGEGMEYLPAKLAAAGDQNRPHHSQRKLQTDGQRFEFRYNKDEATGKYYMEIKHIASNKVVKQIPSERYLELISKMKQNEGLVIDEKI